MLGNFCMENLPKSSWQTAEIISNCSVSEIIIFTSYYLHGSGIILYKFLV